MRTALFLAAVLAVSSTRATEVRFITSDSVVITGDYISVPNARAVIVLCHSLNVSRRSWDGVVPAFHAAGYATLAIDLRGHGHSTEQRGTNGGLNRSVRLSWRGFDEDDFRNMVLDVAAAVDFLDSQPDAPARIILIGSSIGSNSVFRAAVADPHVVAAALLSPGLDYRGVRTDDVCGAYGQRPIFLLAETEDSYAAESVERLAHDMGITSASPESPRLALVGEGYEHGSTILEESPDRLRLLIAWLDTVSSL